MKGILMMETILYSDQLESLIWISSEKLFLLVRLHLAMTNLEEIFSQQLISWQKGLLIIVVPKSTTKELFYLLTEEEKLNLIKDTLKKSFPELRKMTSNWISFQWISWKPMILKRMKLMQKYLPIQFKRKTVNCLWSFENFAHKIFRFSQQVWPLNFTRNSEREILTQSHFSRAN